MDSRGLITPHLGHRTRTCGRQVSRPAGSARGPGQHPPVGQRSVRLTLVGEQLRADLLPAFRTLREGMARARPAAEGKTGVLRVGMLPGNAHDLRPF
ncbi:hypothetical protein [Saccharothrix sp.]|uniref:hypothetical protein n=1 Tax=Saccharothrix sp. TaxID=1873460 RepID=UPI002810D04E|nr:hypothetical protein [Saccharothrix sp.]